MAAELNDSSTAAPAGTLQSICYERGSLRLLDQTRLPLETVYLDIKDSTDGWNAIRDMVVRGAPAIAIAAALSLAVEIFNLAFSGKPEDAASFIFKKLEYLVSSRPTAVNLSDAAEKLRSLILKTAETADKADTIFQAYIDAAETMLVDDVAANEAIGFHGASHLRSHLENLQKISVLTHCNTGSLATAGYGTALGVIRALQTEGWLKKAFCTETRPFNQGSRLTAFELVHEQIPATLIADSAAAALMKAGRVNAVVVGADRIAANGDTANKIGTYSLALSAYHHGIRFYVAAPITSIDLSISSGEQIVIEERSEKELLHSDGGRGKQVAASGISVWNPAFDVTPARLITAIITEKGVIKKSSEDAFDIQGFIENAK
ncbi:methylthioribose-1-phosphate isomerase-like [Zingiber officinale]|uniref:methylthioribose-1-phosphate isomerase-like n=1 Tax=Zingiber officinale TaxID=94328 RepID=UPI001C4B85E0|nr:methylthioribose-1-phosphate isomerase-like [Zingiber officinale]